MSAPAVKPKRRSAGRAARPRRARTPGRRRRLPSRSRILAMLLFAGLVVGTVTLLNGPWLRVSQVAHAGERYTPSDQLETILTEYLDRSVLSLDSAGLEARLLQLPAVAEARVRPLLPGRLSVEITEKEPAATWLTPTARLVLAADGAVIGSLARGAELSPELGELPAIDDQRPVSGRIGLGGALPAEEVAAALRLLGIDPELVGSRASRFGVRIHEEYGFILVSTRPAWRAAMGYYQAAPGEEAAMAVARLEQQLTALRTLFEERSEGQVRWVDARNPGKVYWAS